jgi:hypothetical protein
MGNKDMEPMDSLPRLRPLPHMGSPLCNFFWTASHWLLYSNCPPKHTASLSRGVELEHMTQPQPQSPPPRPPMYLSWLMALNLLIQLMGSSQQPLYLQDGKMVTSLLKLVNLSLAHGVITSPT